MALRWTAAGLLEAQKTFRRLKAYRQLPILRNALQRERLRPTVPLSISTSDACPTLSTEIGTRPSLLSSDSAHATADLFGYALLVSRKLAIESSIASIHGVWWIGAWVPVHGDLWD